MPHFVLSARQKNNRYSRNYLFFTAAAVAGLLLTKIPSDAVAQNTGVAVVQPQQQETGATAAPTAKGNSILGISAQQVEKNLEITIRCEKSPEHTAYELPGSGMKGVVVDIAAAEVQNTANLVTSLQPFNVTLNTIAKKDAEPQRIRLEFSLPEPYSSYTSSLKENSVILVIVNFFKEQSPAGGTGPLSLPATGSAPVDTNKVKNSTPSGESLEAHLPPVNPTMKNAGNFGGSSTAAGPAAATSPLAGADNSLITVDFYKVDLHNVFRLLGEISGYNIIVSEGVAGTLTLALHEVPWDFVLDIILNLKDLAKEQRHNTIVIYPKSKEFVWPQRSAAESSLNIDTVDAGKTNSKGIPIVITQGDGQALPPEAMEAKKIAALAIKAEKEGSVETAVQLYEKAFDVWPDKVEKKEKGKLANRIASIYLVKLNQNAKAVYYANKALAIDKKNGSAALNAAIGHANMEENSQAQQYFDQSISMSKPSREALFSYAVFSERQKQYDAALRLLNKYSELYGEDLDSMVSRARIQDQQGRREEADKTYTAILHAGFSVPQDLRAFIINRTRSN
jgi:type IV pilus assembly protein PilQ